jgi:hypothetical protein
MDHGLCSVHVRRLVGTTVIVAFLMTVFVPAVAAQAQPANSNAFSTKSIEKAVTNNSDAMKVAEAPKTPKQATKSGSFFKTRTGLLVLAIMAVGTGYTLYSLKEDRIHGSNR